MNKYIFILNGNGIEKEILTDLKQHENIHFVESQSIKPKNRILAFIQRIHFSYKLNSLINLPLKGLWYKIDYDKFSKNDKYIFIVTDGVLGNPDISLYKKIKKKVKNSNFVLYTVDSIDLKQNTGIRRYFRNKLWDYVYTFDYQDSKKYDLEFLNYHYYSNKKMKKNDNPKYDLYYISMIKKERFDNEIKLVKELEVNNINCNVDFFNRENIDTSSYSKIRGINFLTKKKPYNEVLKEIENSNCILEILQPGQKGQTLRYFEAVVYNKKLLTNNENIKNMPFYNPKYMKIFNTIDDIDFKWVRKREKINYNYNNEFSPIHFIKEIDEII